MLQLTAHSSRTTVHIITLHILVISVVPLENGHPASLRNLDGTDQHDIAGSDVVVADKISSIPITVLVLCVLENGPNISSLEKVRGAGSKKSPP